MRVRLTLCLAVTMASCTPEPTAPPPPITRPVMYYIGGGITGYGTQLFVAETGKASAWSVVGQSRDPIGERQLSQVEAKDLEVLMTPFCEFGSIYGLPTADVMF